MASRYARLIVLTGLAIAVVSVPVFSQGPLTSDEVAFLRANPQEGSAQAQYNLGVMYDYGEGVEQNDEEAARWFRLAAEQGYANAQYNLGVSYSIGQGVPENFAEAVDWFRLAAEQGLASAQYALGTMYDVGGGVPQDYDEAIRWYRLAAEEGIALAQLHLGRMYAGETHRDFVQAHMWLHLAASRLTGEDQRDAVEQRDNVAQLMTPTQITEAQRLAREWNAAHPREP